MPRSHGTRTIGRLAELSGAGLVVALATAASACTVAYRYADGGATAKAGVAGGTTHSIYIGDRGGVFTRLGLGVLAMGAAAGSQKTIATKTEVTTTSDRVIVTQTKLVEVDQAGLESARALAAAAADPRQNFGGLSAGLEIATRSLGGDTSGWMFDFGWKGARRYGTWGLRGAVKLGFGQHTFHGRTLRRYDPFSGGVEVLMLPTTESTYTFFGVPSRLGVTYRGALEAFAQLDLNLVPIMFGIEDPDERNPSPSSWRVGGRLWAASLFYVEGAYAVSSFTAPNQSVLVEVGLEM